MMILLRLAILLILPVLTVLAQAQVSFDSRPSSRQNGFQVRDSQNWLSRPACQEFVRYNEKNINTFGLVVLKNGRGALELYGHGADEQSLFKLWSVSKTFTSLWLGTQIGKNSLSLNTPVSKVLTELGLPLDGDFPMAIRERIRLRHLWTFSSGLDWCESETCDASSLLRFYYGKEGENAVQWIRSRPMVHAAGRTYNYSSGDVTLISAMLQKLNSAEGYRDLPSRAIFEPLGIKNWALKRDSRGVYLSGADLFLGTRDVAKLGQLILQKGKWATNAKQAPVALMPNEYFAEMITTSRSLKSSETSDEVRRFEGPSGGLIWLNQKVEGIPRFLPRAPYDTLYSNGAFGQFLIVFPSAGIVIARNGGDTDFDGIWNPFVEKALSCFSPESLLPDRGEKVEHQESGPLINYVGLFNALKSDDLPARLIATEYCDCLFVGKFKSLKSCDLLLANDMMKKFFPPQASVDWNHYSVTVRTQFQDPTKVLLGSPVANARAVYHPERPHDGCRIESH